MRNTESYQPITVNLDHTTIERIAAECARQSTRVARASRSAVVRDLIARALDLAAPPAAK